MFWRYINIFAKCIISLINRIPMEQLSINIQNAGTLKDLLDNTIIKELQHLQLSGYLNGDDIRYLREILSSSRYNRIHLDL